MKNVLLLILLSSLMLTGCNKKISRKKTKTTTTTKTVKEKSVAMKGVQFMMNPSYKNVMAQAKAENKPVLLDFYTTWCAPCKWLDKDVFELDVVADLLNKNFINVKVDAEKGEGPSLAQKFSVGGFPTLVYLNSDGDVVEKQLGMTTATNVMNQAKRVMSAN